MMSTTIVRIEGEIIHHPAALRKLGLFLSRQPIPHILVTTVLPQLAEAIGSEISRIHESEYTPESLERLLDNLSKEVFSGSDEAEFRAMVMRLTGLLKGIHYTGDYSPALKDQVVSYGEQLTVLMVSARLKATLTEIPRSSSALPEENSRNVVVMTPDQLGLKVTAHFGNATFTSLEHPELFKAEAGTLFLVPGSFGIAPNGRIARTGKSAADYTAAFLAGLLKARQLILWNLRVEFTSADPEIVPEAGILRYLTFAEASELSYFDHFDFHPRTVEPLLEKHIPIQILNAFSPEFIPDTIINSEEHPSDSVVKSIASNDDISVLKLNGPGVGLKPGILAKMTGKLADRNINIKSVITSQVSINILLGREDGEAARKIAYELGFSSVSEITLLDEITLVAIVGHGMQDHYGISARLFTAVAENEINVILSGSGASDLVSYLIIAADDKQKCIKAVYQAFLESKS